MKNQKNVVLKSLIVCAFLLLNAPFFHPSPAQADTGFDQIGDLNIPVLVQVLNADRLSAGLHPLRRDADLDRAAALKAQDMITAGYFAHTSPEGITPWFWFEQVEYHYFYAGENLAIDFSSPQTVQRAWMNSPDHRQNILNPHYEDVGYAIARGNFNNINGEVKDRNGVIIVQLFGRRSVYPAGSVSGASQTMLTSPANLESQSNNLVSKLNINEFWQSLDYQPPTLNTRSVQVIPQKSTPQTDPADWTFISLALLAIMATTGFQNRFI